MLLALLLKLGLGSPLATAIEKILSVIWLYVLAIGCLFGCYWYGGHQEHKIWQIKIKDYEQRLAAAEQDRDQKISQMQADHKLALAELQTALETEKARKQQVQTIIKEVPKYVTAKADAQCVLTAGFVSLLNLPLQSPGVSAGVPAGPARDVDAPAGVAASAVAQIVATNYTECTERGTVIDLWQKWYVKSKAEWDALKANMPNAPAVPH
jgi:hypothetical protein